MGFLRFKQLLYSFYIDIFSGDLFLNFTTLPVPKMRNIFFSLSLKSKTENLNLQKSIFKNPGMQLCNFNNSWIFDIFELTLFCFVFFLNKKIKLGFKFLNDFKLNIFDVKWENFRFFVKNKKNLFYFDIFFFSFLLNYFLLIEPINYKLSDKLSEFFTLMVDPKLIFVDLLILFKNKQNFIVKYILNSNLDSIIYKFVIHFNFFTSYSLFNIYYINIFNIPVVYSNLSAVKNI